MFFRSQRFIFFFLFAGAIFFLWPLSFVRAESLPVRLSGRILLQVQAQGEAWYVNPLDLKCYYLGRPADAFTLMRQLGLGVSEADYQRFAKSGALNLKGRIILRAQASGEAYYVHPDDGRLHYLGRPADAFALMRRFGLGISNQNLSLLPVAATAPAPTPAVPATNKNYTWRYQNKNYTLGANLSASLHQSYQQSPKVYSYYEGQEPADIRDSFYGLFLKLRSDDNQTNSILTTLRRQAADFAFSADDTAAFIMAFIQYLPYDHEKIATGNNVPYYPFETLYLQKGVCADKTFLAVLWLRNLGYGAAILDFPESNHSAAGIACPVADSLAGSGYCYIETTNYFPIGVVPPAITNGQAANSTDNFENLFNADRLGSLEIKQKSQGKIYQGVAIVKTEAAGIKSDHQNLDFKKVSLDAQQTALDVSYQQLKQQESALLAYKNSGDYENYNQQVPIYNQAVAAYQAQATTYEQAVVAYNVAVQSFNARYRQFYQQ